MLNPYEVMYDAVMEIRRHQHLTDEAGYDTSVQMVMATGVKCRYSISNQGTSGSPVPSIQASNQLFCGLETDILEGDEAIVTLRNGRTVKLRVGEVHPYSFQYQCCAERIEKA